jgi:hypothetical protein
MFFLVSICTEAFDRMMKMRLLYRYLGVNVSAPRDAPELLRRVRRSFGGRIVLVDWEEGTVVADLAVPGASGLATGDGTIAVCSWIEQSLYLFSVSNPAVHSVTHPWFNHLHSVDITPDGRYLVASAGSDAILEVTSKGEVVWEWFGPEHGYDRSPDGQPTFFDRKADYRELRRSTADQAMHVTSAAVGPADEVLATLFHQGSLVCIERETGNVRTLMSGLSRPHGVHRHGAQFIVSDTLGHRVLLLDSTCRPLVETRVGSEWLQDTVVTSAGTYLALENVHIDRMPEPGLRNRIAEVDSSGRRFREVHVDADLRLFTAREVDPFVGSVLAQRWGRTGSYDAWDWR